MIPGEKPKFCNRYNRLMCYLFSLDESKILTISMACKSKQMIVIFLAT